ncbi:MAG TPA: histidine phosphatase family protein [Stellaceae bacterium]|jgi:broad specificity phosphatase PhoE|nr:histidine phosphatase family protein [Stellaceae bacterium]
MTLLALIRHAPTAWNEAERLQGRRDPPLAANAACGWQLPADLDGFEWMSSPLRRARDTAAILGIPGPIIEPRLTEMDWGEWEGTTLTELRASLGAEMVQSEAKGLNFRPPGGETPREVQARLALLLREIAVAGRPTGAITHKGVIRAVLALATGWDMCGKPPYRLSWSAAHQFRLDAAGQPAIERLNLSLERR